MHKTEARKFKQIFFIFIFIIIFFSVFLVALFFKSLNPKTTTKLYIKKESKAKRGSILTSDGFTIAKSKKIYKAVINKRFLDKDKEELFIELFSIYSNIPAKQIRKRLKNKKGVVVLSYTIGQKEAKYLKKLSYELRRLKVFKPIKDKKRGIEIVQGLSIIESGEKRVYNYENALTPLIGYTRKKEIDGYTVNHGVKGIEKRFDEELNPRQNEIISGQRDVNGYIILNKESFIQPKINGLDIVLTIPLALQLKIEKMLDKEKQKLGAKEIFVGVMESKTGKILALASSNRFNPKDIKRKDYNSLNISAVEFSFEPGSVFKPLTFSILLDNHLINPYDLVNGHNGRFKLGRKIITDEHKFKWLSAEDVIVYSSNIGMAQLAQKLEGATFYDGLINFGFTKKACFDLNQEKTGKIPSALKLNHKIYKATTSYGYGVNVNFMQLLRAYSAFNNLGIMARPYFVQYFLDNGKKIEIEREEGTRAISDVTAKRMQKILIKTVLKGTGKKAITKGLIVGGKTGTAHIAKGGSYIKSYNTSFFGFANDKTHRYTIGVVVREPTTQHFASLTAVPIFKKTVDIMIEEGYLNPNIVK